jgi:hypothetical protein
MFPGQSDSASEDHFAGSDHVDRCRCPCAGRAKYPWEKAIPECHRPTLSHVWALNPDRHWEK